MKINQLMDPRVLKLVYSYIRGVMETCNILYVLQEDFTYMMLRCPWIPYGCMAPKSTSQARMDLATRLRMMYIRSP